MSVAQQKQIDLLKKKVAKIERENKKLIKANEWIINEMKTGLKDVVERVVRETIEIDITETETNRQKLIQALENN